MGYIQFESVEHANNVADLFGMERPYAARIGEDADPVLDRIRAALGMAHSVTQLTGETRTTGELLRLALDEHDM